MVKKILLIEDERLIKEMYAQRLQDEGFKIFVAGTTDKAEEILKKEKIDLILLDLLLPRESGFEYLKRVRNQKKPKVVVLTNLEGKEYREKTKEMGALDYLLKTDYTPSELIKLIKTFL